LDVKDEKELDDMLELIKAACNATIEHGYVLQVGRYSKYKSTLHDYRSA
jgi:methyl-coenzyme M reductase subunit D